MKKIINTLARVSLLIISGSITTSSKSIFNNIESLKTENTEEIVNKEWTLMIYGKQECLMFWYPMSMKVLLSGVRSGKNLNVAVIQDRAFLPAKMYSINEYGRIKDQQRLGEINMGDEKTLKFY